MAKRIKDVAEDLEVSSQTIRNYLKLGNEFFSERATHKTRKQFTAEDIVQLRLIKSHFANGLTAEDITQRLSPAARVVDADHDHGQDIGRDDTDTDTTPEDTPPPTTDLALRYEQTIASQQQTIILQNDFIENLKSDKDRLQSENDRLREDLDREHLPWWQRLFGNSSK